MADIKLTDKSELTNAVSNDWIHIVDVSDTSSDPAGTSKKITVQNIVSKTITKNIKTVSTNYNVLTSDQVIIVDTAGVNLNLPVASSFISGTYAKTITIINISSGNITITPNGSERIDNEAIITLVGNLTAHPSIDLIATGITNYEYKII